MSANPETVTHFAELRRRAQRLGPKRVALVAADDDVALTAASTALSLGIAIPVLIGDASRIRAKIQSLHMVKLVAGAEIVASANPAAAAADLAGQGDCDILLKGRLRTDELLRAVLNKQAGLRTDRLLSDVFVYEDHLAGEVRLIGITDGGLNVSPNLQQKREIVQNAIEVMRCLGFVRPKIAIMSATELVAEAVPSTLDAKALTDMGLQGDFGEADIFGPLALDCALVESAARAKGITHPVAGHADCMVVPNIESGNLLGKSVKYLGGSQCAHVIAGASVPILIPSRVESADDKLNAIALGVIFAAG